MQIITPNIVSICEGQEKNHVELTRNDPVNNSYERQKKIVSRALNGIYYEFKVEMNAIEHISKKQIFNQ